MNGIAGAEPERWQQGDDAIDVVADFDVQVQLLIGQEHKQLWKMYLNAAYLLSIEWHTVTQTQRVDNLVELKAKTGRLDKYGADVRAVLRAEVLAEEPEKPRALLPPPPPHVLTTRWQRMGQRLKPLLDRINGVK